MASKNYILVLMTVLVIMSPLSTCASQRRALINIPPPKLYNVIRLVNRVTTGNKALTVHCKSKDNDLGFHDIAPGQSWSFRFQPNFFGGTLFFCHVTAPGFLPQAGHYFDAYDENRDVTRCKNKECCWDIFASGPCDCASKQCIPWTS